MPILRNRIYSPRGYDPSYLGAWVPRNLDALIKLLGEDVECFAGIYLIYPSDLDEAFLGSGLKEEYLGVAEFCFRLMSGEGYDEDEWAEIMLYKDNPKVFFRFWSLVESGLRRRPKGVKPLKLKPRVVLRWASKALLGV